MRTNINTQTSYEDIESPKKNTSSLDARQLLAFWFEEVDLLQNGEDQLQASMIYFLDWYFSILETPDEYKSSFDVPTDAHSEEFLQRREVVYDKIYEHLGNSIKNLQKLQIDSSGLAHFTFSDGEKKSFNLVQEWNDSIKTAEKQKIEKQTREEEKKLQENVAKEAFFGGNMVVEYSLGAAVAVAGISAAKTVSISSYTLMTDIGKRKITLKNPVVVPQNQISGIINHLLDKWGWFQFDTKTNTFVNPTRNALLSTRSQLQILTWAEYQKDTLSKQPTGDVYKTEAEFNAWKQQTLIELDKAMKKLNSGTTTSKAVFDSLTKNLGKGMEALFFPVFMAEFHKNQTALNLVNGLTDVAAFNMGAKIGRRLGVVGGAVWKVLAPIIGGTAMMFWKNVAAEKLLEVNRLKWESPTKKTNYSDGRSLVWHAVGGFFVTELLDGFNAVTRKNFDIGIKSTDVNLPFGIHLATIPEITWFQGRPTMGTSPREWIQASAARDVDDWNENIDTYKIDITKAIYALLGRYYRNEWSFSSSGEIEKAGGKEKLFESELRNLLLWGQMSEIFANNIEKAISGISAQLSQLNINKIPNSTINEIISINVDSMKVNQYYIEDRRKAVNFMENLINNDIAALPVNKKTKEYIATIPKRMLENKELYETAEEKRMYYSLIKNKNTMDMWGEKIKIGIVFASILDKMAENKLELYFLNQLQKGNKEWFEWTFL